MIEHLPSFFDRGEDVHDLPQKVAIQLNDTHPALAIAGLMRMLVDQYELPWEVAWEINPRVNRLHQSYVDAGSAGTLASRTVAPRIVPRHLEIIYEINRRFLAEAISVWSDDVDSSRRVSIIEDDYKFGWRIS